LPVEIMHRYSKYDPVLVKLEAHRGSYGFIRSGGGWLSKVSKTNCKDVAGIENESGVLWGSYEVVRVFLKGSEHGTAKVHPYSLTCYPRLS
jgi:hypothetical protein